MKIPLTQGFITQIDSDFRLYPNSQAKEILDHKWCAHRRGRRTYAVRGIQLKSGKIKSVQLHRVLMNASKGVEVHHIDGDGLNNRINNLRFATRVQNSQGFQRKSLRCSSKFRGVYWNKVLQKWHAQIKYRGRSYHLGYFQLEEDAARAYDLAAKKFFGDFATYNL